ncbi:DnaJ-domain-containing protein [Gloeophyllum trabeum ATCC 11539]|uniref:DnaJ-domain-containing protein n=1 Tax=Gloeophyllum trabeum (strain ATCC 11539 / FP-39264 / Madison 617) TaxID=670483 RepID=S7QKH6_GLOTA|nr:DnaJ-domain-containing protein [Gloeophyllum trabeum ATCC 11539]EPQ59753.1 DnaJ-domain-containing protein [Gloeophyllum trabeum ATCC 11539]
MASYHYDEAGTMALYFIITFLFLVLVPLTLSLSRPATQSKMDMNACQCQECIDQRAHIRKQERGPLFLPKLGRKTMFVIGGWALFAFLSYKVSNIKSDEKVYDPFEILEISRSATEKEIKSRYKKLSKLFHPDKVKLAVNQTMEQVEARFVELTKAYKALTDETIRKNWELYGHPDGRQEVSMGIALPKWIIEGRNNIWVLGAYGLVFGGALPAVVGQWWFGSRKKTKDGVEADTAATFFKTVKEEAGVDEVLATVSKVIQPPKQSKASQDADEAKKLEGVVRERLGKSESSILAQFPQDENRKRALVLLYAHLLRFPVESASLKKEQADLLLNTPALLNAMLNIITVRNWLTPTLAAMRLHACVTQAIPPGQPKLKFAQLPGIGEEEALQLPNEVETLDDFVGYLAEKGDGRVDQVKKAVARLPRLEVEDITFKVIGERIVTPLSIVHLLLKLRLSSARSGSTSEKPESRNTENDERKDEEFLNSRKDAEDIDDMDPTSGWAHAPHWPGIRKPGWWVVLADDKMSRLVQPPMKITDVPFSDPRKERNYRSYRMQFQAPQGVGVYTWKVYLVSDTFVGEEVVRDVMLKVDDVSALNTDEQGYEDEISDPEEDSLAGQMAAMRGHSVKKRTEDDESDEESSTDDDDEKNDDDSSSDSD